MAKVKVWNDNTYPFKQVFKGETIEIAPKSFILMDRADAISFKSKASPIIKNGQGVVEPSSYKMIRVEKTPETLYSEEVVQAFRSHVDGSLHASKEELEAHEKKHQSRKAVETETDAVVTTKKAR